MKVAPLCSNEQDRLQALLSYQIMDTEAEACYDDLTRIAATICHTPIALLSLVDRERQWFKSRIGLSTSETHRDIAFCAHAILQDRVFEVPDARLDERFNDNPLVIHAPSIRFYAAAPIIDDQGYALGTLCVIDWETRSLDDTQKEALSALARQVSVLLKQRLLNLQQAQIPRLQGYVIDALKNWQIKSKQASQKPLTKTADKLHACERVMQLRKGILAWSDRLMECPSYAAERIHLALICDNVLHSLAEQAQQKQLSLNHNCPTQLVSPANHHFLSSLLYLLLSKTIDFAHQCSEVRLAISANDHELTFTIIDSGVDLPRGAAANLIRNSAMSSASIIPSTDKRDLNHLSTREFVGRIKDSLYINTARKQGCQLSFTIPVVIMS